MPIERQLTEDDAREALRGHVVTKALEARQRYGPEIDLPAFERILVDPEITRWPTRITFEAAPLRAGEFGFAAPDPRSSDGGWAITLHPRFEGDELAVLRLAAYHIVSVNYGEIATHEEAELFGATLLGLEVEAYYTEVCALADTVC